MATVHFLLVFNRTAQMLIAQEQFAKSDDAVAAYEEMEAKYDKDKNMEIVLVGADSIETVMKTHGNYFAGAASSSPYLAGI